MRVEFTIPGEPVGKQRPKASFQQRRIYTPEKTINYETFVKHCYYGNHHFVDGCVAVQMKIYMPIPSSTSKKKQQQMLDGTIRPTKKPDIDNIVKSILDGLNGVAYTDDKQVVVITAEKFYGTTPCVNVVVSNLLEYKYGSTKHL
jgi:Holliday junction resolvase RusA-like endonuclease